MTDLGILADLYESAKAERAARAGWEASLERRRRVIVAARAEGWTFDDIAKALEVTRAAVIAQFQAAGR